MTDRRLSFTGMDIQAPFFSRGLFFESVLKINMQSHEEREDGKFIPFAA
jgi:hypothetical protein